MNYITNKVFGKITSALTALSLVLSTAVGFPLLASAVVAPSNPGLPAQSCGLDVALVLDTSGSIGSAGMVSMKSALNTFVDTFLPSTPTQFSVTSFSTTGHMLQAFSSNATTIKNSYAALTSNGSTNWQQGLVVAQSTFDPRPSVPNVVIFASDGQPNRYGVSGSGTGVAASLAAAVTEADIIKTAGTRIITIGIGNNVNQANMIAISSADAYYPVASFSQLTTTLQSIATQLCGGTITATKVIDRDGNILTTNDQSPAAGWNFTVADQTNQITDADGKTPSVHVNTTGPWSVTETPQAGYTFVSASCTNQNQVSHGTPGDGTITGISLNDQDIISCVFYNKPAGATLNVIKVLNKNLNENDPSVPADFTLNVHEATTSQANPFDTQSFQGVGGEGAAIALPGDTYYAVGETNGPSGYAPSFGSDCSGTIGVNETKNCTVTNSQIPDGMGAITVVKVVINDNGGTSVVSDFPLSINQGDQATSTASGAANFLAPGAYVVSETGDPAHYAASYSGACDANGNVTVVAGQAGTCTITNDDIPATLTIAKHTVGGNGTFNYTVTSGDTQVDTAQVTTSSNNGSADVSLNAGSYTVAETDSTDWTEGSFSCRIGDGDATEGGSFTVGIGEHATCSITNTAVVVIGSDLTMSKDVDDTTPDANQNVTYTITVGNAGPDNASNVVVSDLLPSGLSFVSTTTADTVGIYDSSTGNWTIGDLANGASVTLHIIAKVTASAGQTVINTATASMTGEGANDPDADNNDDSVSVTVNTPAPAIPPTGGGGGGGNGPIMGGSFGVVLGASTIQQPGVVLGASCGLYLDSFLRKGYKNDAEQVKKLQTFLNENLGGTLPVTGYFGSMTDAAVRQFQAKYPADILKPWVEAGIMHDTTPTGYVYKTTKRWINLLKCPSLEIPLPELS